MVKPLGESPPGRRGGLNLLRQVYDELYHQLGDEFSPAELLLASQTLIDVTKAEYGLESYQDGQLHPGYYSFDVDHMINNQHWWLLKVEQAAIDVNDDEISLPFGRSDALKKYYNPDVYLHRG